MHPTHLKIYRRVAKERKEEWVTAEDARLQDARLQDARRKTQDAR